MVVHIDAKELINARNSPTWFALPRISPPDQRRLAAHHPKAVEGRAVVDHYPIWNAVGVDHICIQRDNCLFIFRHGNGSGNNF